MPKHARQSAGFTLLELLVAMSLMVVVAASLYTALHTGFTARRSALAAVEPTSQALNAIELLKQDVIGVIPVDGALAESFIGTSSRNGEGKDADSVAFYTTQVYGDEDELVGGVGKIELELQEDTDEDRENYRLVRKITRNLLSPRDVDPEEQVLCRNVTSLNLRYFDGDSWLDTWDSTADANSLPVAMEVEIQVAYQVAGGVKTQKNQTRRLMQSFAIPCGGEALTDTESETATTTGAQSPGQVGG
ncbi:MAG: prepilin-type N-terminal cleavage/methylation domain-containing protein [Phycisphaerales bacterium]|nr:MAG: prepilin-type N-terminal cleavage/methylation domain-containing protein [Phycisphaerales bacterium]